MPREADRLDAILALLNHTDAGEGGYYDYLAGDAPHLNPGEGADKDPERKGYIAPQERSDTLTQ